MIVCPHRPPCPGCPRLGEPGVAKSARSAVEALALEHGLQARFVEGKALGFRHRARLAVRGRIASPKIGIFEAGSHRVVDIPRCLVHHPLVNDVASELRRAVTATHSPPYSDEAHRGLVRYVQVVVERRSVTAQVVIVTNSETVSSSAPLLDALRDRLGARLHSLFWNGNPSRTNTILGPHWERWHGPAAVEETIGGARVFYPPGAFGQSHLDLSDSIVASVHDWVPDGARVAELYAGVGPVGLGLAHRTESITFNEVAEESLRGLALGIDALAEGTRRRTSVVPGPAGEARELIRGTDVVVVDPPRKGLDRELRDALVETPPVRLAYVACGLPSFLEDARVLVSESALRLTELTAFDLFPHTEHVEIVARFDRA